MTGGRDLPVGEVWREQSVWSQAADRLKRSILRRRLAMLLTVVTGAVLSAVAAQLPAAHADASEWLAFCAALAVGVVPVLASSTGLRRTRDWTRLRAVSEALKADVHVYLARTAPFGGPERAEVLRARTERLLRQASDLRRHLTGRVPDERALPGVTDVDSYVAERLVPQIERYYRPRAREMRRRLAVARGVEIALGLIGAVLAGVVAAFAVQEVIAWVGVTTTMITAVTAHAATSRYEYQEIEYTRTAEELERLRDEYAAGSGLSADSFVDRCEHVISIQNESWMVRLSTGDALPEGI